MYINEKNCLKYYDMCKTKYYSPLKAILIIREFLWSNANKSKIQKYRKTLEGILMESVWLCKIIFMLFFLYLPYLYPSPQNYLIMFFLEGSINEKV